MTESSPVSAEYQVALAAVREAADLCRNVQSSLKPAAMKKPDRSPVTVADFGSQALVCSRLRTVFPDDPIIAEEDSAALRADDGGELREGVVREVRRLRSDAGTDDVLKWIDFGGHEEHAGRYWTLDPIDGTKGFLRGDQYAVALALIRQGEVVVAALACPNLELPGVDGGKGIVAGAVRGGGATLYALDDMSSLGSAAVSSPPGLSNYRFCESVESRHTSHSAAQAIAGRLGIDTDPVRLDSQAKYAVVGAGEAEIYMRLPSGRRYVEYIWDHAAGALFVEEAGGTVTDVTGKPLDFGHGMRLEQNRGVVVSNGGIHDDLIEAIGSVLEDA